jgi:hypothetical protein
MQRNLALLDGPQLSHMHVMEVISSKVIRLDQRDKAGEQINEVLGLVGGVQWRLEIGRNKTLKVNRRFFKGAWMTRNLIGFL